MRGTQEPAPPELRRAINLLVPCHDVPGIFKGYTPGVDQLRLDLITFLTNLCINRKVVKLGRPKSTFVQ